MRYINNDFGTIRYFVTAKSCLSFARTWMEVRIPKIPKKQKNIKRLKTRSNIIK